MKIKAAVDARRESGSDIVIVARTDSRQAVSLEESLWRSRAFADAGADVLFIDALASKEEMKAFCEVSPLVPKMANMLEGGGKTPILTPLELEEIGYKVVVYPLSLIGVSIQAMQDSLTALKSGRIPPPGSMPSFEEIKEILGFNKYYEEEKRYATSNYQPYGDRVSSNTYNIERVRDDLEQRGQTPDGSRDPLSGIWSRTLRIKNTGRDGIEKLDVRVPAGILEGITNMVPALGGVNIKALLDDAAMEVGGKVLLDSKDTKEARACNVNGSQVGSNGSGDSGQRFKFQPRHRHSGQLSILCLELPISWNSTSFDLISTAAANTKMVYEITEQQKVGLGLICFGISFTFLGVTLFFDRGLLALGNILWLAGVVVLIGWYSTLQLFRKNYKGSISFLLGLFFLFVRWPIVGIILEIYGCLGLFGGFWPSVSVFLCHIPVVGWFIQYPVSFLNRLGRGSN
ncbi:hypothetical protein V6N11_069273 [Hibiscus sabdariffa]|uniref:Isocitrate lyase n=2 Tax=Hibiscus sabdariffa TaxID=183260 RepID=A0ABR2NB56_9ROSI